jgi:hypothetical protein
MPTPPPTMTTCMPLHPPDAHKPYIPTPLITHATQYGIYYVYVALMT